MTPSRARAVIGRAATRLEAATGRWVMTRLPLAYAIGGSLSTGLIEGRSFRWTERSQQTIGVLARETVADTSAVTAALRSNAAAFARTGLVGVPVMTAAEVAALAPGELAALLRSPVGYVVYQDGSHHHLSEHGDMLARTRAATVHNLGTIETARELGVTHCNVSDGAGCGRHSHNDGDSANGAVWTLEECAAAPLSHPRCARSFHPIPATRRPGVVVPIIAGLADFAGSTIVGPTIAPRGRRPRSSGGARRLPRTARAARRRRR